MALAGAPDARPGRRWRSPLALGAVVFLVHTVSPSVEIGDSRLSVVTAWRALTGFSLNLERYPQVAALAGQYDLVNHAGHLLPYFPWPTMLLALPGDLLLAATGHSPAALSITGPARTFLIEIPTASLIVAATAVALRAVVLAVPRPWATPRTAMLVALAFAFTTSAWSVASRALWQQTASMLFLTVAMLAVLRLPAGVPVRRRWAVVLGSCLALAMITRPTDVLIAALVAGWLIWRRPRAALIAAGPFAGVLALFAVVSLAAYGSILPPYYLPSRLDVAPVIAFWPGLALNLVSPSRGLAVFDPVLLLAIAGVVMRVRAATVTRFDVVLALSFLAQLVLIAKFGSTGGAVYGPRLMIDVLPFLMILAAPAFALVTGPRAAGRAGLRLAAIGIVLVLGWGLFVNATGAILRGRAAGT